MLTCELIFELTYKYFDSSYRDSSFNKFALQHSGAFSFVEVFFTVQVREGAVVEFGFSIYAFPLLMIEETSGVVMVQHANVTRIMERGGI